MADAKTTRPGDRSQSTSLPTATDATAWIDVSSPAPSHLFAGLVKGLDGPAVRATVRQKGPTVDLIRKAGLDPDVVGSEPDWFLARVSSVAVRTLQLWRRAPPCDVSLSFQNAMAVLASRARGIPSIHFADNDITAYADVSMVHDLYNRFQGEATFHVVPAAFETAELTDRGADPGTVFTYDGYKEDVSVATFDPDPTFTGRFPFEEYVVVRPEALTASYVDAERSIVPVLLQQLVEGGYNVVYLPRGRNGDEAYGQRYPDDRVYTPDGYVDGLQLAWHARCVLTGSGSMAREAACMDKPAVSFFPSELLSVDRALIDEGRIFHSRDPADVVSFVDGLDETDRRPDRTRSRAVHAEVCSLVGGLIDAAVREEAPHDQPDDMGSGAVTVQ